jgi:hypothetical protein
MSSIALALTALLLAQQGGEQLQDIQVGSSRIGGPGLTESERKASAADEEDDVELSEETLPKKGSPKRLPGLQKIAGRYYRAPMWKDACDRYDQIIEEYGPGPEGLESHPDGKKQAARSFYQCAEIEFRNHEYDKTEALLKKSEQLGTSDYRHSGLRRQMKRETFREEMGKGNVEQSLTAFRSFQAEKPDEDERIWVGEQLAKMAWDAYKTKDQMRLQRRMKELEEIAPMNSEYRRLKDQIEGEGAVLGRLVMFGGGGLVLVLLAMKLTQWRSRAKVTDLENGEVRLGRKNKFIDDE